MRHYKNMKFTLLPIKLIKQIHLRDFFQRDHEAGFTLVEVIAAVVILGIFALSLLKFIASMTYWSYVDTDQQKAMFLARKVLEQSSEKDWSMINWTVAPKSILSGNTVIGTEYTLQLGSSNAKYSGVIDLYNPSTPPSNATWANSVQYIEVIVSWNAYSNGKNSLQTVKVNGTELQQLVPVQPGS